MGFNEFSHFAASYANRNSYGLKYFDRLRYVLFIDTGFNVRMHVHTQAPRHHQDMQDNCYNG